MKILVAGGTSRQVIHAIQKAGFEVVEVENYDGSVERLTVKRIEEDVLSVVESKTIYPAPHHELWQGQGSKQRMRKVK